MGDLPSKYTKKQIAQKVHGRIVQYIQIIVHNSTRYKNILPLFVHIWKTAFVGPLEAPERQFMF